MQAILLVTWIISGQPPSSYQTQFTTMEACEAARAAVLQEASRLTSEWQRNIAASRQPQPLGTYIPPNMVPYRPRYAREQVQAILANPSASAGTQQKMLEEYKQQDWPVAVPYTGGTVYVDPRSGQQFFVPDRVDTALALPPNASVVCVNQ
jgi:hypothetical protein